MFKLDALPQLAIGSHPEDSGRACIMNAISYLSGDRKITDLPSCVWRPLALLAQGTNDSICLSEHRKPDGDGNLPSELCPACTHRMWMIGTRLIGTAGTNPQPDQVAEIADRWIRQGFGWLRQSPDIPAGLVDVLEAYLDDLVSTGEFGVVLADYSKPGQPHRLREARAAMTGLLEVKSSLAGSETWFDHVLYLLRHCFMQEGIGDQFSELVDIFEDVMFFLATPPTPLEVREMARRAGLVMV